MRFDPPKFVRVEWLLLVLVVCVWLPQFCLWQKHHQHMNDHTNQDVAHIGDILNRLFTGTH